MTMLDYLIKKIRNLNAFNTVSLENGKGVGRMAKTGSN